MTDDRPPAAGSTTPSRAAPLADEDYQALLAFRTELRQFLRFSKEAARSAGLTPQQHQALLAVRGHPGPGPASVSSVAEALQLQLHSTTELLARTEAAGLLQRATDPDDRRRTLCTLTPAGETVLASLSHRHRQELRQLRAVVGNLSRLDPDHT